MYLSLSIYIYIYIYVLRVIQLTPAWSVDRVLGFIVGVRIDSSVWKSVTTLTQQMFSFLRHADARQDRPQRRPALLWIPNQVETTARKQVPRPNGKGQRRSNAQSPGAGSAQRHRNSTRRLNARWCCARFGYMWSLAHNHVYIIHVVFSHPWGMPGVHDGAKTFWFVAEQFWYIPGRSPTLIRH